MLDLLRTQGRNGAVALLESLMIHYPILYTQVTGRKPSTEPSRFSGLHARRHLVLLSSSSVSVDRLCSTFLCRPDQVLGADGVSGPRRHWDAEGAAGGPLRGQQDELPLCLPAVGNPADHGAGGEVAESAGRERAHAEAPLLAAARGDQAEGREVQPVHALHGGHRGEVSREHAPARSQPAGQASLCFFSPRNNALCALSSLKCDPEMLEKDKKRRIEVIPEAKNSF